MTGMTTDVLTITSNNCKKLNVLGFVVIKIFWGLSKHVPRGFRNECSEPRRPFLLFRRHDNVQSKKPAPLKKSWVRGAWLLSWAWRAWQVSWARWAFQVSWGVWQVSWARVFESRAFQRRQTRLQTRLSSDAASSDTVSIPSSSSASERFSTWATVLTTMEAFSLALALESRLWEILSDWFACIFSASKTKFSSIRK